MNERCDHGQCGARAYVAWANPANNRALYVCGHHHKTLSPALRAQGWEPWAEELHLLLPQRVEAHA